MALKVVTANRLRDGAIVYRTGVGAWSEALAEAVVVVGEAEEARLLAEAAADVAARRVVAPYAFEVTRSADGPQAISQRERIRARGPSVRPDLAKPAAQAAEASRTE